jgi:hypothetical protein
MSDDHNVYSLRNHMAVSPVNPNESLHSSLRDRLVQEGDQGSEQEPGNDQVLTSVDPMGEGTYTGICSLMSIQ